MKSHSRSGLWPRRSSVERGTHVYVAPVSTKASSASKRCPCGSPISIRTRNEPMLEHHELALLAEDVAQDGADLAEGHVVLHALDEDGDQVGVRAGGLFQTGQQR